MQREWKRGEPWPRSRGVPHPGIDIVYCGECIAGWVVTILLTRLQMSAVFAFIPL